MTFEKALEAMKQGKKIRCKFWDQNVCIGIDSNHIIRNMTYNDIFHTYDYCMPTEFLSRDLLADDWEIHEPKTLCKSAEPMLNCRCEIKPEEIERLKKTLSENTHIVFEPCEEDAMEYANKIEITFKSGETITYDKNQWDDYAYDGKSVIVKYKGAWIGIYNFDNVFCVELKQ